MDTEWADDEWAGEPRVILEPIRPARSHLNYWIRHTHQRFAKNFGQLLKAAGIIASEWAALRELYRPQRWSPVALGQAIGMSKGGASKLVIVWSRKGSPSRTQMNPIAVSELSGSPSWGGSS